MVLRSAIGLLILLLVHSALQPARAQEKRIALLIANQSYDRSVGVLQNPHNDIALVAKALTKRGFEVLAPVRDAKRTEILGAVRDLARRLSAAGPGTIGFLYYSGHGAAEKDTNINYLIPVDARDPGSTSFWDESVKLDEILRLLDGARGAIKFVVFDACRNELQLPFRDTSKGLVPVAEQQGFFVAYSTAPGRTATDRGSGSGPYAHALAAEFDRQGLDHLNLFQNVKEAVISSTGGAQHPWESNGLARRVYLTGEPTLPAEVAAWETVRTRNDPNKLREFLAVFGEGSIFAATAHQMIEKLEAEFAQAEQLQHAREDARKAQDAQAAAQAEVARALAERDAAVQRQEDLQRIGRSEKAGQAIKPSATQASTIAELEQKLRQEGEKLAAAEGALKAAELAARQAGSQVQATEQRRRDAETVVNPEKLAALPQVVSPISGYDGAWRITRMSQNCPTRRYVFEVRIRGSSIEGIAGGGSVRGTVSASGAFQFTHPSSPDRGAMRYSGTLRGSNGSGTFSHNTGGCNGTLTANRQ